ncbi:MAG TPA: histidine kinase [Thermoanaerobaculia bacterium]|nr:histidine kinase [Thermoanaerobaculia bacterium]
MTPRNLIWGIACCWLAVEAVYLSYSHTRYSLRGGSVTVDDVIVNVVHWGVIVLMSAVVIAHSRLQEAGLARIAALIVAGTLFLAVIKTILNDVLDQGINRGWNRLAVELHPALADVAITFGAAYALVLYNEQQKLRLREARLSRDLAKSELAKLRAQLQPQYLFNTLDVISARAATDSADAQRMIGRLGDLLRMAMQSDVASTETTVSADVAFTRAYLDLQRLDVVIQVDDDARQATVPALLLQSLIEHARPLRIDITLRGEMLRIVVSLEKMSPAASLANVRERLAHLYGDRARVAVKPGTSIELELPANTNATFR